MSACIVLICQTLLLSYMEIFAVQSYGPDTKISDGQTDGVPKAPSYNNAREITGTQMCNNNYISYAPCIVIERFDMYYIIIISGRLGPGVARSTADRVVPVSNRISLITRNDTPRHCSTNV